MLFGWLWMMRNTLSYGRLILCCVIVGVGCEHFGLSYKKEMVEDLIDTRVRIIQSKLDQGQVMLAQYELDPLLKQYPEHPKLLTLSGFIFISLGNHQRAVDVMHQVHMQQPRPASALNYSAALIASKRYSEAHKVVQQGIALSKKYPYRNLGRLYHNQGYLYELKQRNVQAIDQYEKAIYHLPGYLPSLIKLAELYEREQNLSMAKMYYQRWFYVCRTCFRPLRALVQYYMYSRDWDVAQKMLQHYLRNQQVTAEDQQRAQRLWSRLQVALRSVPKSGVGSGGKNK